MKKVWNMFGMFIGVFLVISATAIIWLPDGSNVYIPHSICSLNQANEIKWIQDSCSYLYWNPALSYREQFSLPRQVYTLKECPEEYPIYNEYKCQNKMNDTWNGCPSNRKLIHFDTQCDSIMPYKGYLLLQHQILPTCILLFLFYLIIVMVFFWSEISIYSSFIKSILFLLFSVSVVYEILCIWKMIEVNTKWRLTFLVWNFIIVFFFRVYLSFRTKTKLA